MAASNKSEIIISMISVVRVSQEILLLAQKMSVFQILEVDHSQFLVAKLLYITYVRPYVRLQGIFLLIQIFFCAYSSHI